jgi:soluble lytic murein transglycosylase
LNKTIALLLIVLACPVLADSSVSYSQTVSPDRFEQRQLYLDALQLIRTSQFTRLKKIKPQLRTYALYPYLEYTEMAYRISRHTEADILAFSEQHRDTPLVEPLVQHWLGSLAKHGKWEIFLRHYDSVTPTKELACHQGYALYKTGQTDAAMTRARELWTVGYSQPEECDAIFNVWRGGNGITPEIAWQRFAMSLQNNEKTLSNYLLRFVDRDDKPYASNYRLVHLKPKTIKRYGAFSKAHIRNREIILHGVKRLARTDPEDALMALQRYASMHNFDPEALEQAYAAIGLWLARKSTDATLLDTLPIDLHRHPELIEDRLRQSLRMADWGTVLVLINLLDEESGNSNRWQYWKARVLAQSADPADQQVAEEIFTSLSGTRSFYGFVSADILKSNYNFEDEPRNVTLDQILSLEESPGIQRALELFALGERSRARREWYFSTSAFSVAERQVAARVALRWGWYKAAIQSMIDAGAWNHLDFRFPMAYQDNFIAHARRANIPVQWSLAIARQESAFMPDARSTSGALGVMQLMPGTAALVANKLGVKYQNNTSLTQPDLNIQLGTNYLGQMLRRFQNNRILASAAYNAGPGRVDRWLNPDLPFDVWIEVIPFRETRNYVQNVLMFSNIYARRMNEPQPLIFAHERDYFSPQQITLIQDKPIRLPKAS